MFSLDLVSWSWFSWVRQEQNGFMQTAFPMYCFTMRTYVFWFQLQFWHNILNLYYITGSWKLSWYPLTGILCQREAVWVAAESENLWSGALHTTHHYYNYQYFSVTLADIQGCIFSFPINCTCYQYTAVGKYCTLCVQMLDGANWHEAPGKPWPVFYLLTLQVTWPRPGSQVICGVCCLCFLK